MPKDLNETILYQRSYAFNWLGGTEPWDEVLCDVSARAVSSYGGTAYLEITAAVETGKLADSLGALDATMRTLAADPVDATALAWAKLRTARSKSLRFMTNGDAASELVRRVALGWGLGSLDAFASDLAGATADDVTQALRACAAGKPTLSIVGDEAAAHAAFRQTWP